MLNSNDLSYAGQIDIQQLKLVSTAGLVVDLDDYLIELNIYEDIFSNFLHGDIMLNDSRNLISKMMIIGEEFLIMKIGTPTLGAYFEKYFRVYAINDQQTSRDTNTQIYTLQFCSMEAILDANVPIYRAFKGKVSDVVTQIYEEYLKIPRTVKFEQNNIIPDENSFSTLFMTETSNNVKFISPGWSPAKCINWLSSKSLPAEGKACDFLFWETTAGFVFSNIENLYTETYKNGKISGEYYYIPVGTRDSENVIEKVFLAESFEVINFMDHLKNYTNGFLGTRLITVNLFNKEFSITDYDYPSEFSKFMHSEGKNALPPFPLSTVRSPAANTKFYPINQKLFNGVAGNVNERIRDIYGNRISKLNELNNIKINITIPGRSDMTTGTLIKFNYPDITVKNTPAESGTDTLYSGLYLITAIRHKINFRTHMMTVELIKDSISKK